MKTLLIYATNSGTTIEVSNYISSELTSKGHEVTIKDARDASPDEYNNYDLIIFGSSTWGEGEVHESFKRLFEASVGKSFPDKNFAVFGLGDSSYQHFCGAADQLEEYVKKLNGKLIIETLKINNFLFSQQDELPKIIEWSQKILSTIS